MIDSTNPRVMADNIRELFGVSGSQAVEISALQTDVETQGDAIEALRAYSTDEVNTGKKWIDNSDIYLKVFIIENMPNNTTVTITHNITNLGTMITCRGVMQTSEGLPGRPIPSGANPAIQYTILNLYIGTGSDFSNSSAIVILEYTKIAAPTPDILPSPDPDTRTLEEPEREEIEPEPIEEKK